jgi:hypothetical protein
MDKQFLVFLLFIIVAFAITNPRYWVLVSLGSILIGMFLLKTEGFVDFTSTVEVSNPKPTDRAVEPDHVQNTSIDADQIRKLGPSISTEYDNSKLIDDLLQNNPSLMDSNFEPAETYDGDDLLLEKMKDVGKKSKEAMDNRVRFTSDNFRRLFVEELDERESTEWWGNNDKLDQRMVKDEIPWHLAKF